MKKSYKRWLSASMAAVMTVSSAYVSQLLSATTALADYGNEYIATKDDNTKQCYNEIATAIKKIAAGNLASTSVTVTFDTAIEYNGTNLSIDTDAIMHALLIEYPYEMYWFDKTRGMSTSYSVNTVGTKQTVPSVTFNFTVAQAYKGSGDYVVDTAKTTAAAAASTAAKAIVEANKSKTDYEKLVAYKEKICELVAYNTSAVAGGVSYGDPWQLVYVFDGDENTNVVCEGYSKAFQYLCDLTTFSDSSIRCATVTGTMAGGTGAGGHMWNIVTVGSNHYLVDVTNCDGNSVGADDYLFMKGATEASATGCKFNITKQGYDTATVTYTYDSDTTAMYSTDLLTVSTEDYNPLANPLAGTCGESATWELTTTDGGVSYTLAINGTGAISDYAENSAPWSGYLDKITAVTIGENITKIGGYAFSGYEKATITIPATVTDIYGNAFKGCTIAFAERSANLNLFDYALAGIKNTSLELPISVSTLRGHLLDGAETTELTLKITDGSIEADAFAGSNLTTINAPCSIKNALETAVSGSTIAVNAPHSDNEGADATCSVCNKHNLAHNSVVITPASFTYNGTEQTVSFTNLSSDCYDIKSGGKATNAGTNYSVTIEGKGDYYGTKNVSWSIGKADPVGDKDREINVMRGVGTFTEPAFTGVDGQTLAGKISYETHNTYEKMVEHLNTVDYGAVIEAYKFTPNDDTNYNTVSGQISFDFFDVAFKVGNDTATAANAVTIKANPTYGDTWAQILKLNTGLKAVIIDCFGNVVLGTDVTTGFSLVIEGVSDTSVKPNAGTYTYKVLFTGTVGGNTYTNHVVASRTVNVAQKELTVSAGDYKVSKEYDGTTAAGTGSGDFSVTGKLAGDSVTINATTIGEYTSAGVGTSNVDVTVTIADNTNYKLTNTTVSVPAEITAKSITPTVEVTGTYTYTGSAITPTITVKDGETALTTNDFSATVTNNINAGTATIKITAKSGGNYTFSDVTKDFTIDKAGAPTVSDVNIAFGWNTMGEQTAALTLPSVGVATAKSVVITDDDDILGDTATYTADGIKFTLNENTAEKVGKTATITVTFETQNYLDFTANLVVTLTAKKDRNTPECKLTFVVNNDTITAVIEKVDGAEYSFDGTTWSEANTAVVASNTAVKAYIRLAETDEYNASPIVSAELTSPKLTVKAPVISPKGGNFTGSQTISISCGTNGATIYYTTDGSKPTTGSARYTQPFTISETTTVQAIAVKDGMTDSGVVTEVYTKKTSSGINTGGGSSSGSGGSSGGSSSTTKYPSVDGKTTTWSDVASDIEKLPEGKTETISLNGITTVPVEVIKAIATSNAEVTLKVDSVFSWTINGSELDDKNVQGADLSITKTTVSGTNELRGVVGTGFKSNGTNVKSELNINFKSTHSGEFANLFKKVDGKLVFVDNVKIDENGAAIGLEVSEKGEYVVMLGKFSDRAGDMDNDGVMNAKDSLAVIKNFLEIEKGANPFVADMNADGRINAKDALIIMKKFIGLE